MEAFVLCVNQTIGSFLTVIDRFAMCLLMGYRQGPKKQIHIKCMNTNAHRPSLLMIALPNLRQVNKKAGWQSNSAQFCSAALH